MVKWILLNGFSKNTAPIRWLKLSDKAGLASSGFHNNKNRQNKTQYIVSTVYSEESRPEVCFKAALHRTERSWQPPESIRLNQQDMQNIQRVGNNTETMLSRRIKKELETIAKSGSREHEKEKDKTWERWAQPFNRFTVNCKDTIHDVT